MSRSSIAAPTPMPAYEPVLSPLFFAMSIFVCSVIGASNFVADGVEVNLAAMETMRLVGIKSEKDMVGELLTVSLEFQRLRYNA